MDTDTPQHAEKTEREAALKAAYPAVTQVAGRAVRFTPLEPGQFIALQSLDMSSDDVSAEKVRMILAILEGCIGEQQYQSMVLDMGRKRVDETFPMKLFIKIMDKARRENEKDTPTP